MASHVPLAMQTLEGSQEDTMGAAKSNGRHTAAFSLVPRFILTQSFVEVEKVVYKQGSFGMK